ncbi:hypothetical protein GN958_ATG13473 [Phytophthora infestans]|uniref:Secreted RxLR effector peptide protein n=1 Tax=Phytophthora infestans TaxID=4787 RepID=A0A8S9UA99_PHYIN|nr:hypothetical protein GN958_ATG13473 [Phytophthora infestans]
MMVLVRVALLVTTVFVASADPAYASKISLAVTSNRAIETPPTRFLRAYTTNGEERGISVSFPGLEKISKAFTTRKTSQLQGLLKADDNIDDAFKTLGLSTMHIGNPKTGSIETKKVVELFSSKNVKVWSQHAASTYKGNPDDAMLTALTKVFGEKKVATMILLGKDSRSSKSAAKKLETAQFNKWYTTDKLAPDEVLKKVLDVDRQKIHANSRAKFIWGDYMTYVQKRVKNY